MNPGKRKRRWRRLGIGMGALLVLVLSGLFFLANFYVEPVLRKRLHTLIVEGSDSLYTYSLGGLETNLFGGNITVSGLQVQVDSNRYRLLQSRRALPALVMQLKVDRASVKGIGLLPLLFNKKILIDEIASSQADVRLLRTFAQKDTAVAEAPPKAPLWKAVRSKIADLAVDRIRLDGIKFLYRNAEEAGAAKLQFDRCDALFEDLRIDSAAVADTARIGYVAHFSFKLHDLKYRTADSAYKMKAEWITYDSKQRLLRVDSFKLQPTLKKDERVDSFRRSWYTAVLDRVDFNGLRLDRYLRFNRIEADSLVLQHPQLSVFQDKGALKTYRNQIGRFPHQLLRNADAVIALKALAAHNLQIESTERDDDSRQEGTIRLDGLEVGVANIVNDPALVLQNPVATATAAGRLLGSPIDASFRFYLDSADGQFEAKGRLRNVTAAQINPLSSALANVQVPSATIEQVSFTVRGQDYNAAADVQMRYSNLSVVFLKRDKQTGANEVRGFLTNLLNKYALYTSNPGSDGERTAQNVKVARLTTQSFFGLIWQAVFAGMQAIILKRE